ncbi:GrpB family protein [Priestia megaterium]|uniref:GrpB family protein n=1 Tax=Priestia megaterium TaxID=1404 RepID=A0ABD4WMV5_PRIMG|nr:GrpB family protein [Priestia megaterium]MDD9781537.1 GrpB family protein [Priestia megaterium]MED3816039.1 GrpB family protein [Priestia megaterium]
MVGLERGVVKLEPYNYKWIMLFDKERELLYFHLKDLIIEIEHVGSTSIEGLSAKPIIDIAIGVSSLDKIIRIKEKVKGIGYVEIPVNIDGKHVFVKDKENKITHFLHVMVYNQHLWRDQICFRDSLRSSPDSKLEYVKLKQELAKKYPNDVISYTNEKKKFVDSILKKAREL